MRTQKTRAHGPGLPTSSSIVPDRDVLLELLDVVEDELRSVRTHVERRVAEPEPTLVRIPVAAERLGLSTRSLRALLRRPDVDIEVINLGERKQHIRLSDLERLQREGLK